MKKSRKVMVAMASILCACTTLATAATAAETYRPECFAPAPDNAKVIKHDKRDGPYKVAFVNGLPAMTGA
ncbi:MAG: hypothetical protein QM711_12860 [Micropruina sp.]|uniref:hypothetical protein n=1 Tax=Micropruina sp. TaxID=2737536 RepID=UPI0039E5CBD5